MKELVDLYSKLVIGTFTFLGPSVTLLVGVFIEQLARGQTENRKTLKGVENLLPTDPDYIKIENTIKRKNRLYNPRRQVKIIFICLFGALLLICVYYYQRCQYCFFGQNDIAKGVTLLLSVPLYARSLYALWQMFCSVISAKTSDYRERKERELETGENNLLQTQK